jgi:hypothetical protein
MKEAIEGKYYMVKEHEKSEFVPAECVDYLGKGILYFRFTNGMVMKVNSAFEFEPLNHVSQ